jgi:YgiT-type zinc finger domain-containing protein
MTREELIEFAKYLDEGCDLLGEGYIESRTDEYLQKVANKNFVLADVSGQVCVHCGKGREMHTVASAMCLDRMKHFEQTLR